ncbi:putative N-acetyltransferase camello [Orchesella cincta]|uniref:Putative N-acetyltransferase camello n=1 Tax=Orchesella cincta TaxID=48709 RepID=A0A1D2MMW6_ORCCI|nr:putative N-acetyltransferase camello [Orchesella cincta]
MESPIIVIRPIREEDCLAAKRVVFEGTLEPVNRFFFKSIFRETCAQAMVMVAALLYIVVGVKFQYCFLAIPIVIITTYVGVWTAHYYKAKYLHHDMKDIMKTYMSTDKNTCFFVAEALYSPENKNRIPAFVSDIEFNKMNWNGFYTSSPDISKQIVGTIAIARYKSSSVIAWLRRTAVKKEWRKKGVGSQLVDAVIRFCSQKGFVGIELVTTECHDSAKVLYEKKKFDTMAFYHKKLLNYTGLYITMYVMHYKTAPYSKTSMES